MSLFQGGEGNESWNILVVLEMISHITMTDTPVRDCAALSTSKDEPTQFREAWRNIAMRVKMCAKIFCEPCFKTAQPTKDS